MEAKATAKMVRHSARKLRQVASLIRGKSVDESFAILGVLHNTRKGARVLEDVLKSAVANLQNTEDGANVGNESLSISSVTIDKGPMMKRIRARAQGRAFRIEKNLSHVTVVVTD